MKKIVEFLMIACLVMVSGAWAQWKQNDDIGPYDYNDMDNWNNGIISGTFTGSSMPGLAVTFDKDTTVNNIYISGSNTNVLFRSEGGNQTLLLTGSINAPGTNGGRIYTFGSLEDGQRLAIDLLGGNRTVNTSQGRVITFLNEVMSSDGANGIIKTGAGALILTNTANTFGGKVSVSGGRVVFGSLADIGMDSALGRGGEIELAAGGTSASNAIKLQFGGDGLTVSVDATSNRVITLVGSGAYFNIDNQSGRKLTLTANFNNQASGSADKLLTVSGNNGAVTELLGVIGDAGADGAMGVSAGGQGSSGSSFVLRLTNTANTFSGAFATGYDTIIEVTKLANQGQASSLGTGAVNSTISVGGRGSDFGSSLRYVGTDDSSTDRQILLEFRRNSTNIIANNSPTNANLSFTNSGTWTISKAAAESAVGNHTLALQGSSTGTSTISGVIVDYVEVGGDETRRDKTALTVNSQGVWRLTGENTYTGNTTVSGGTLLVDGVLAGTGTVSVGSGARLGGSGTIHAMSTLAVSGGVLTPGGDGAVGMLTVGALTLQSGAICTLDFNSNTLTVDLVKAAGAVNLGNRVASLSAGVDLGNALVTENSVFTILQTDGVLSGSFANDEVRIGDNLFQINYKSNAIELLVIPEPKIATLMMTGVGGLLLTLTARRKCRTW
jgi:autotransporter-associated beta strand protein